MTATRDHRSFSGRRSENYFRRSQPRVNHIVEANLESTLNERRLRLCKLPPPLATGSHRAFVHMSRYRNAHQKVMCAVADGHLTTHLAHDLEPHRVLAYAVPKGASAGQQHKAFRGAMALAVQGGRAVSFPLTWKKLGFCEMFDAASLLPNISAVSPVACDAASTVAASGEAELERATRAHAPPRLCLSFEALVEVVDRQPVPALARCPAPKAGTICNVQPRRRAAEKWGKRRGLGRR